MYKSPLSVPNNINDDWWEASCCVVVVVDGSGLHTIMDMIRCGIFRFVCWILRMSLGVGCENCKLLIKLLWLCEILSWLTTPCDDDADPDVEDAAAAGDDDCGVGGGVVLVVSTTIIIEAVVTGVVCFDIFF